MNCDGVELGMVWYGMLCECGRGEVIPNNGKVLVTRLSTRSVLEMEYSLIPGTYHRVTGP